MLEFHRRLWCLALCSFVSGCVPQASTNSGELKLGTLLPITGDLSQYGSSMQDSARLLVDTVNDCGGVIGQPVTLVNEDDQTDPAVGAQAMSKLAEIDRVAGVIGAASSAASAAAVDIAVRNKVLQISPSATSPEFTSRAQNGEFKGFWARTAPPDTFQGQALAQLAIAKGFKSVSILAINNDYGNGLVNSFTSAFNALGGKVINQPTRYDPANATFDSEISKAYANNPEAVLLVAYPETGSLILKSVYQAGEQIPVIATDGLKEGNLAELVGKNAQGELIAAGIIGTAPSAGGPALQAFQERYQDQFKREPKVFDANTWDAAALMVLAAEAAKGTTGDAIASHLQDVANPPGQEVTDICEALSLIRQGAPINYQGASGTVDLNEQGDVTGSYDIWEITQDGSLKVIDKILVEDAVS